MSVQPAAFAINSYSYIYTHTAAQCLEHLAECGYSTFELMLFPGHLWPPELDGTARKALRQQIVQRALRVITLNIPAIDVNIAAATREMREYSLAILSQGVELAGDLGVPAILFGPGKPNPLFPMPTAQMMGHFFAAMDKLVPLAAKCGTRILMENIPICFLPDAESLMSALDTYGNPDIGVVYDVANAVFYREDPATGLRRVRSRLELIHLSDTGLQAYRHDPVGQGVVRFEQIPPVLKDIGYDKLAMLEIITRNPDRDIADSAARLTAMGW